MIYDPIEVGLKNTQKKRIGLDITIELTTDKEFMTRLRNKHKWAHDFLISISKEYLKNPEFIPTEKQYAQLVKAQETRRLWFGE